jgi:uncharacterized membrane protein YfcA
MAQLLGSYPTFVWVALLATGVVIGVLAGLLGIGGGIVAVPVLLECYLLIGMEHELGMRLAIGTAQASIVVASLGAAVAHARRGTIDWPLVRAWLPGLVGGTFLGLLLTGMAPATVLTALFAAVAAFLAATMLRRDGVALLATPRGAGLRQLPPSIVGTLASALGVGAGTLSTPVLSLFGFPVRRAIGAGALFNVVVALPATAVMLASGWGRPGRPPDSVGDVSLFCAVALALPALFVAPVAARFSSRAPVPLLRRLFALCLAAIALRLLLR